ncbi:hypothetical protein CQW23_06470 [Capsicum baccatum]|uniref:NB-ARC domain-containing protein n=1 Tax=Capsicum baccatum TaxID=33114 RepID=A0A2G2X3E6_CAPBA|nr:hypothetical protein CQW23_06470 [Capsicum baccatum]
MVGRDDQMKRLVEDLTRSYLGEPKVIPIVGMGGIETSAMDDPVKMKSEAELADMLQKSLKRKGYLIVLDDIWSCKVWDGVRRFFPTEENAGSRILLATYNDEVARYAAFSNKALSSEFEIIGNKIAEKCQGLPLTIVVVAGFLKSKRAIESCDLKTCLLHFGIFPEDSEIPAKNLVRSWMADVKIGLGPNSHPKS